MRPPSSMRGWGFWRKQKKFSKYCMLKGSVLRIGPFLVMTSKIKLISSIFSQKTVTVFVHWDKNCLTAHIYLDF